MACHGDLIFTFLPLINISPDWILSSPNSILASSVLPEPTSPARPNISPSLSVKEISRSPIPVILFSSSKTPPGSVFLPGYASDRLLPTIIDISWSLELSPVLITPTTSPSRITVILSVISNNSSRRWDIYTIVTPLSFNCLMISNSAFTSLSVSGAVGSSIMMSFALLAMALAISTSCILATESSFTRTAGSMSTSYISRISRALLLSSFLLNIIPCPSFSPQKIFSATDREPARLNS